MSPVQGSLLAAAGGSERGVGVADDKLDGTTVKGGAGSAILGDFRLQRSRLEGTLVELLSFEVQCPHLAEAATGILRVSRPSADARGVVVLTSGQHGTGLWSASNLAQRAIAQLCDRGLTVVELAWDKSWLSAAAGLREGVVALAARPATVFRWVHEEYFKASGLSHVPGRCGFALAGVSGGASQLTYALTHYGLAAIVDLAIPISGPPHAAQEKGCLRNPQEQDYWYDEMHSKIIDLSYGFDSEGGPCARHDRSWTGRWLVEGNASAGIHYFPHTTVHMILGARDRTESVAHALDFLLRLRASGSPRTSLEIVDSMGHLVQHSSAGIEAVVHALLPDADQERDLEHAVTVVNEQLPR